MLLALLVQMEVRVHRPTEVKLFRQEAQEAQGVATEVMGPRADIGMATIIHRPAMAMDLEHVQVQEVQAEQVLPAQQDAPLVRLTVVVQEMDSQAPARHVAVLQAG